MGVKSIVPLDVSRQAGATWRAESRVYTPVVQRPLPYFGVDHDI